MSYNKSKLFYYMKPVDFYERYDIKRIEKNESSGDMLTLYDKLILYTMKKEGFLAVELNGEYKPYPIEEIAEDYNYPVDLVKRTLDMLIKYDTIELTSSGIYFFPDALTFTKQTTKGAERKKAQREKKMKEEEVDKCLTYLYQEQDIQQEEDKNIEKELDLESDTDTIIQSNNKYKVEIEEIISYLNEKSNKRFTSTNEFVNNCIIVLLKDGYKIRDFKKVIDNMSKIWVDDPDKRVYLRPGTLFNKDNFPKYLNGPLLNNEDRIEDSIEDFIND